MRLLIIILCLFPGSMLAQVNLVPNGSFESHTDKKFPCSWLVDDDNVNDYIHDWFTPIGTTTDVMSSFADFDCWAHTPETGEGYMAPHSGDIMIGFINYSPDGGCKPNEWHEYVSVELTERLTPGNLYCMEFWVALGTNSYYATNNIGALLTTESIENTSCKPIFRKPQVNITKVIDNTGHWMRFEASFLADSSYKFLTIGNFFPHTETEIITRPELKPAQNPEGSPEKEASVEISMESKSVISYLAYYFIDDVKLYLCPSASVPSKNKE